MREPGLLLLDEPFSALDALTRMAMHRLVLRLWQRHQPAVLLVTHDVDEALVLADRVLVLAGGRLAFSGLVDVPRPPRDRDHPDLIKLRHELLRQLGVTKEGKQFQRFDPNGPPGCSAPPSWPRSRRGSAVAALLPAAGSAERAARQPPPSPPAGRHRQLVRHGQRRPADVSNVTLHIGDQAGTGAQALLTAAGLIGKLPFKAQWSDFTSGPPMLQAMGAGSVDVGGVGNAPPVFAAAGGDQIAIVGALQANPHGSALLVPKGSPIRSLTQLRGKRIAVAQGSSADYHLLTVLNKAGLSVHDVTLVYLQPAAGLAALTSGHVDAWDIWSPFIEEGESMNGATAIVTGQGYGSPYSFTVASRAALADPAKAAAIGDYLSLIAQAHRWANSHLPAGLRSGPKPAACRSRS